MGARSRIGSLWRSHIVGLHGILLPHRYQDRRDAISADNQNSHDDDGDIYTAWTCLIAFAAFTIFAKANRVSGQ